MSALASDSQDLEISRGRRLCAGLFWQPLPGVSPAQRKRELKRIAEEQAFDLMVEPGLEVAQVGYATERQGAKAGRVSIAAAFARAVQEQGLARTLLFAGSLADDRWYYYAQRDGLILSGSDRIGSEAEIRSLLEAELAEGEWELVMAPASWGINNSVERKLWDFLPVQSRIQYQTSRRLRPVRKRPRDLLAYWKLALIAVAVGMAVVGAVKLKAWRAAREMETYLAQQRELEAERLARAARPVHPWRSQPRALAFAQACESAAKSIRTLWPGGWTFTNMTCSGAKLTATWSRAEGFLQHVLVVHPDISIDASGQTARLILDLPKLATEDESLPTERERIVSLLDNAQRNGYAMSLSAPPVAAAKKTSALSRPDWREVNFTLSGSLRPASQAAGTLDGNGFRINAIESRYANGILSWSMKGIQYVQQ